MKKIMLAVLVLAGCALIASALDVTVGGYGFPAFQQRTYVAENSIDLATDNATCSNAVPIILIPSNSIVHAITYQVVEGVYPQSATLAVGDNTSVTNYVMPANVGTAGVQVVATDGIRGTSATTLYTATNTVNIQFDGAMTTATDGLIRVRAVITDLNVP